MAATPYKAVRLSRKSRPLHIEAPGCIINIHPSITADGREVVAISINADGTRYAGQNPWFIEGIAGEVHQHIRIVQVAADAPAGKS